MFQRETLGEVIDDIQPLIQKHYAEIAITERPLNVNWKMYQAMEAHQALRIYTYRIDEQLVGYNVFAIYPSTQFEGHIDAVQDVLFIDPAHRGNGKKFMEFCDQEIFKEAHAIRRSTTPKLRYDSLLLRMGYVEAERVFRRVK